MEGHLDDLYRMIAAAARYGHQQLSEILASSSDRIERFNDAIFYWIDKENKTGHGMTNRHAEGG